MKIVLEKTISSIWDLPKQIRKLLKRYRSASRPEENKKPPGMMKIKYIEYSSECISLVHLAQDMHSFLHVAYKKAEIPCKYKCVNYLNVNHTFQNIQFQKIFQLLRTSVLGSFCYNAYNKKDLIISG